MHKQLIIVALLSMPTQAHAQVLYQRVLEPAVGDYSAVVSAVPKGTDGAVLLAEYVNLDDTTDSGLRLFEVDGMGAPVWSRRFTFDSLGYAGGYDDYLTRFGTKLLAEHPDGGYVFVGKAPGVDSTGLLFRTDADGALLWWKETPAVPFGLLTFPNGDVVVYGWGARYSYPAAVERYDPAGNLLWEGSTFLQVPVKLGVALSDTTMALVNGEGLERNVVLVSGDGTALDGYFLSAFVIDIAAGPGDEILISRSSLGPPQTHRILRFDGTVSPLPDVPFMDGAPVADRLQAMVLSPSNGLFLTGERRTTDDDSGHVVVYGLNAGYTLELEYLLDPNAIGTYPTWRSLGYCVAACADGSVVVAGMADEDDGTTPLATGYYARLADPSTRTPNVEPEAFSIAQPGHGRFLISFTTGAAEELLITDVLGHVVERKAVRSRTVALDLSHHTSGVYLFSIHGTAGLLGTQRVVVE